MYTAPQAAIVRRNLASWAGHAADAETQAKLDEQAGQLKLYDAAQAKLSPSISAAPLPAKAPPASSAPVPAKAPPAASPSPAKKGRKPAKPKPAPKPKKPAKPKKPKAPPGPTVPGGVQVQSATFSHGWSLPPQPFDREFHAFCVAGYVNAMGGLITFILTISDGSGNSLAVGASTTNVDATPTTVTCGPNLSPGLILTQGLVRQFTFIPTPGGLVIPANGGCILSILAGDPTDTTPDGFFTFKNL